MEFKNFYLPKNSKTVTKQFRNGTVSEKSMALADEKMAVYEGSETVNHFGLLKGPPGFVPKLVPFRNFNRTWLLGGVPKRHRFGITKRFQNGKNGCFWWEKI